MTDCPDCGRTLRHEEQFAIALDACTCGGLWFDAGELSDWLTRRQPTARNPERHILSPGPEAPRSCPRPTCREGGRQTLESFVADSAQLGRCSHCRGFWVPRTALIALVPGYRSRGFHPAEGDEWGFGTAMTHGAVEAIGQILLGLFS